MQIGSHFLVLGKRYSAKSKLSISNLSFCFLHAAQYSAVSVSVHSKRIKTDAFVSKGLAIRCSYVSAGFQIFQSIVRLGEQMTPQKKQRRLTCSTIHPRKTYARTRET